MSSSIILSTNEKIITIPGPSGLLEAVQSTPVATPIKTVGIVCHPHPLHGGTMNNKVVHTIVKSFHDLGMTTIRFNYRGVGNSAGSYGNSAGETEDVLAVMQWVQLNFPDQPVCLAGFSFGAYVSLNAAVQQPVKLLVSIAPPVTHVGIHDLIPACPWIIVHGDLDELFPIQAVIDWVSAISPPPELIHIAGASHFFHGKLIELRNQLTKAVANILR